MFQKTNYERVLISFRGRLLYILLGLRTVHGHECQRKERIYRIFDYLIVGAGLYDATFAREMVEQGKKIIVSAFVINAVVKQTCVL